MKLCLPGCCKSRSASFVVLAALTMFACSGLVRAGMEAPHAIKINADVPGYLARIEQNDPEEVRRALLKAEQYYLDNNMSPALPIFAFVLHGPEVEIFFRNNYRRYKPIVDLAARLSALKVVDIKVCRTRLSVLETDVAELLPFVSSVPFGPAELERLSGEEGFVYF